MEIRTDRHPIKEAPTYPHFSQPLLKNRELSSIGQRSEGAAAPSCCSRMITTISGWINRFMSWLKGLCLKEEQIASTPLTFIINSLGPAIEICCLDHPDQPKNEAKKVRLVVAGEKISSTDNRFINYFMILTFNEWTPHEWEQIISIIKGIMKEKNMTHVGFPKDCTIDTTLFVAAGFAKETQCADHPRLFKLVEKS